MALEIALPFARSRTGSQARNRWQRQWASQVPRDFEGKMPSALLLPGMSFRLARVEARLRQADVANAAGCSRARIAQLESAELVPEAWGERYVAALSRATGRNRAAICGRLAAVSAGPG